VELGAIELLLDAVNNHMGSAYIREYACSVLSNIVEESKEQTVLLIELGGGAAVAKVRKEWLVNNEVQTEVRSLTKLLAAEMNSWVDED
jgi:hypothetical protein